MRHNYPAIYLRGKSSSANGEQGVKIRIAFSRERDSQKSSGDEWKCASVGYYIQHSALFYFADLLVFACQLQSTDRVLPLSYTKKRYERSYEFISLTDGSLDASIMVNAAGAKPPQFVNTGDSDAAVEPSQFIILRGLEPSVTEELLSKGVSKLCRANERSHSASGASNRKEGAKVLSTTSSSNLGAPEGSIKRVFIVRDRRSGESWRFGFAEFKSIEVLTSSFCCPWDMLI